MIGTCFAGRGKSSKHRKILREGTRNMQLILCILQGILAVSANWITPLPDGLKLQVHPDVYVVKGEWTIIITIDEPHPPPELLRLVRQTRNAILSLRGNAASYLTPYQADWHIRLRTIETECNTPRRWWRRRQPTRRRRGLIDAVGSGLN